MTILPSSPLSRLLLAVPAALALSVASADAASAYVSPFSTSVITGRTDMGVDFCLSPGDPIRAVGDGVVAGVMPDWYAGQPYVWYELTSGPYAGRYVYVAEQIKVVVHPGDSVKAGQVVARYIKNGTCIETGWSEADGNTTAAATTGYSEGEVTQAGVSFAHFLISLGVSGTFELTPSASGRAAGARKPKAKKPPVKVKKPTAPPITTGVSPVPSAGSTPAPPQVAPAPAKTTPAKRPLSPKRAASSGRVSKRRTSSSTRPASVKKRSQAPSGGALLYTANTNGMPSWGPTGGAAAGSATRAGSDYGTRSGSATADLSSSGTVYGSGAMPSWTP